MKVETAHAGGDGCDGAQEAEPSRRLEDGGVRFMDGRQI